ncbi:hypothetical protein Bca101_042349 [Brassica carinata]
MNLNIEINAVASHELPIKGRRSIPHGKRCTTRIHRTRERRVAAKHHQGTKLCVMQKNRDINLLKGPNGQLSTGKANIPLGLLAAATPRWRDETETAKRTRRRRVTANDSITLTFPKKKPDKQREGYKDEAESAIDERATDDLDPHTPRSQTTRSHTTIKLTEHAPPDQTDVSIESRLNRRTNQDSKLHSQLSPRRLAGSSRHQKPFLPAGSITPREDLGFRSKTETTASNISTDEEKRGREQNENQSQGKERASGAGANASTVRSQGLRMLEQ